MKTYSMTIRAYNERTYRKDNGEPCNTPDESLHAALTCGTETRQENITEKTFTGKRVRDVEDQIFEYLNTQRTAGARINCDCLNYGWSNINSHR